MSFQYRTIARALIGALAAFASACSSTNPYVENRLVLEQSYNQLQSGNYQQAAQLAEGLYAGRAEQAEQFKLQRYYAAYLTARAHIEAALHKPFLTEAAAASSGAGITLGGNSPSSGTVGSSTSHWVAASYYAGYARDALDGALKEPQKIEDEELLPLGLRKLEVARAQANLDLTRLAVLRRMGFDGACNDILRNTPDMLDVAKCQSILEQAELPAELRPWVFYAGFVHLRSDGSPLDGRKALGVYLLGATARVLADGTKNSMPETVTTEISDWVQGLDGFEFWCGCDQAFQPGLLRCQTCGVSIVKGQLRSKAGKTK